MRRYEAETTHILDRTREEAEAFPWEVVDIGVDRAALWREWKRGWQALLSPGCAKGGCDECHLCGMDRWLKPAP
jgi:hypothetical protein